MLLCPAFHQPEILSLFLPLKGNMICPSEVPKPLAIV